MSDQLNMFPVAREHIFAKPKCPNCHGKGTNRFGICAYCKGTGSA